MTAPAATVVILNGAIESPAGIVTVEKDPSPHGELAPQALTPNVAIDSDPTHLLDANCEASRGRARCIATACMAVGSSEERTPGAKPFAEMWNGSRWSLSGAVIGSTGSVLSSVSCPVAGWCAAVGSDGQEGFSETRNGAVD